VYEEWPGNLFFILQEGRVRRKKNNEMSDEHGNSLREKVVELLGVLGGVPGWKGF